jgi:transposase-like protein
VADDYPKTVVEFCDWFSTEQACRDYLVHLRWPDGLRCPDCSGDEVWFMKAPFYRCAQCGYDFTVTAGTLFADTHKPLRLWFEAIWYITNQKLGASALGIRRVLGLGSYRTAWNWMHKLRRAMVRPGRDRLAGVVEVDETFIGGPQPGKRGRGAAGKTLVLIAAQADGRKIGRIRLARIADASAASLEPAVQQAIEPGACVQTDAWRGYSGLRDLGYNREIIRPSAELGENLLPRANRVTSLLKRWLLGTHQGAVHPEHLDYYLDEFTFRFNRRTSRSRGLLFYRLMQQAVVASPIKGKDLVGGRLLVKPQNTTNGG